MYICCVITTSKTLINFLRVMKNLIKLAMMLTLMTTLPCMAQDFGFPKDKAFYKAHWDEIVKDLGHKESLFGAQYILFDFDGDGSAELYLWFDKKDEYLYANKGGKAVRVSETKRNVNDAFDLGPFYPHFMAPYELLLDQPIKDFEAMEQHFYGRYDIPRIWFGMHPEVEEPFNIKNAINALYDFDCEFLSDAMYALYCGEYNKDEVNEFVVDVTNGYAMYEFKTHYYNMVEFCYWNLTGGEKLLAMHYHIGGYEDDDTDDWFEQTLFMKYDPQTKRLHPIVAPIEGYDFRHEFNFSLPRRGKNISLIGAETEELVWTGIGFKY